MATLISRLPISACAADNAFNRMSKSGFFQADRIELYTFTSSRELVDPLGGVEELAFQSRQLESGGDQLFVLVRCSSF